MCGFSNCRQTPVTCSCMASEMTEWVPPSGERRNGPRPQWEPWRGERALPVPL